MRPRFLSAAILAFGLFVAILALAPAPGRTRVVLADVAGVTSSLPTFGPGQPLTITVTAEDDDGILVIESNLQGSTLSVTACSGVGANQVAGKCDGTGIGAVSGQTTRSINVDTGALDNDTVSEPLTVTLTLIASCQNAVAVTVSANQPGNVGPDDVTVNCTPPTPTPSPTPTATPTPPATATPLPSSTPVPPPPPPLTSSVLSIQPPNTGDGGLAPAD